MTATQWIGGTVFQRVLQEQTPLVQVIENIALAGTTTYICKAKPGTGTADSGWQIQKIIVDGDFTYILWALGDPGFNYICDDRKTYTYS